MRADLYNTQSAGRATTSMTIYFSLYFMYILFDINDNLHSTYRVQIPTLKWAKNELNLNMQCEVLNIRNLRPPHDANTITPRVNCSCIGAQNDKQAESHLIQ